jgi:hypothetical protein
LIKNYLQGDGFREVQCSGGKNLNLSSYILNQVSSARTFPISQLYDPKSRCTFKDDGQEPGDGVKLRKSFSQSGFSVAPPTGVGPAKA